MTKFDYSKLRGKLAEMSMSQKELAERIGISEGQLSGKLSGKFVFKQSEISRICKTLSLPNDDIGDYFFTEIVDVSQLSA